MNFIAWHYFQGTEKLLEIWKNYLAFFWWYFGISRHFWTLFSSWKRDISRIGRSGLHPLLALQSIFENIITRCLGAIVRGITIIFGIFAESVTLVLGLVILTLWLFLPLFLFLGIGIFFSFPSGNYFMSGIEGASLAVAVILVIVSLRSYMASKGNNFGDLGKLMRNRWFLAAWHRIGKDFQDGYHDMLLNPDALKDLLRECDITEEEFKKIILWEAERWQEKKKRKSFWLKENLYNTSPIGKNWMYAFTVHLDKYSTDLSEGDPTEYKNAMLVSRSREIDFLELVLTRPSQNSALVIGEAGVGKKTLVHTLAGKIRKGESNQRLIGKRLLEINIGEIYSGFSEQGQIEDVLRSMFFEAGYAGNVILVIDNIGHYVLSNPKNPGEDISNVLREFLDSPTFQIIGLATPAEFHENIEKKEGIMKYFDKIQMEETGTDQALEVLRYRSNEIEGNRVIFTYQALREIVKLADRYITDSPFPEKALDLMEEVLLYWSQTPTEKYISPQTVADVVSKKVKVPLGEMQDNEKEKLLNLEDTLHQRIIGQDFAIKQIAETMRRARIGMSNSSKPIGSFLFLGPTGVGKTESAKALAGAYFGDESRMIRLDMSEYQKTESIDRLLGSVEINMTGQLTNKVKENPYSLLLLDEIEKAHPEILNLFLQILDEGWLTDAFGKKVNFRNLIIIATSNAGSDFIKESIDANMDPEELQDKLVDHIIKEGIFRPEFLSRFDGVIFFHPLEKQETARVAELQLEKYAKRLKKEENINIQFDPRIIDFVIDKGYVGKFGARSIGRFIQDKIGDIVVKKIISGEIRKGDDYVLGLDEMLH